MKSKRILSLVLAFAMILGTFSFVAAAPSDVEDTIYEDAVGRLSLLDILEGYPDGTFKPDNDITRAEFAAVAVRAKGLEDAANAAEGLATGFTDVPATHWASGYVGIAAKRGIVNGIGNDLFAPEAPVKYEEAITMMVRALGYEPMAQSRGGYPVGYLIAATEIGLLDEVKGVQGTPASRGIVAQIADNALEIPMMIQVGYGTDSKYVVSGSKEHGDDAEEKYLLDEMGFDSIKGRVTSVNTRTRKLTVVPKDAKTETLKAEEGFDFYEVEGLTTKFWYKDDVVVVYTVTEEAKFDAAEYDADEDELELIVEDESYELARDAKLVLDGDVLKSKDYKDFKADYAKIVLNDDDEVVWAQGYRLNGFILVEEVDGNVVYSYDDYDELKVKDYTIVEDGKTIGIDGIEEGDILFYNTSEEFAVVYNNGEEGELDRVYNDDSFKFEGEEYDLSELSSIYFDDGKVGDLDAAILDDFLDDEVTVTVYVDFRGEVVVVAGEVSSVGDSAYNVLLKDANVYDGRREALLALDMRNGEGEKVSYDISVADLGDDIDVAGITIGSRDTTDEEELLGLKAENDEVLKISIDKDGDVTKIEQPDKLPNADKFEIDDSNVKVGDKRSYRLQSNTIVFHDGNDKATTLGNAKGEFAEVKEGSTIYVEKGRVVAVVGETDTDADTETVVGLVTDVKGIRNGKLQFTVKVFGVTEKLVTEEKLDENDYTDLEDKIVEFEVGETSGEIKGEIGEGIEKLVGDTITVDRISGRTIYGTNKEEVELNRNAVIYNAKLKEINLRDIEKDDVITVYYEGKSDRFVDYVVAGEKEKVTDGVVTYINETRIFIDGERYAMDEDTVLYDTDGKTILLVGGKEIATDAEKQLVQNDIVKVLEVKNGVIVEMKLVERAAEKEAVEEAVNNLVEEAASDSFEYKDSYKVTAWETVTANAEALELDVDITELGDGRYQAAALDLLDNIEKEGYSTAEEIQKLWDEIVSSRTKTQESVEMFSKGSEEKPLEDIEFIEMLITEFESKDLQKHHSNKTIVERLEELEGLRDDFNALEKGLQEYVLAEIDYSKNSSSSATRGALRTAITKAKTNAETIALDAVNEATNKWEMQSAVNKHLETLGIDAEISLDAADYLMTTGDDPLNYTVDTLKSALEAYEAL